MAPTNELTVKSFQPKQMDSQAFREVVQRLLKDDCCRCHQRPMRYIALLLPQSSGASLRAIPVCEPCSKKLDATAVRCGPFGVMP